MKAQYTRSSIFKRKKLTKLNIRYIELVFVFVFTVFQYYVLQHEPNTENLV